mgnify:CR=1 FL=1
MSQMLFTNETDGQCRTLQQLAEMGQIGRAFVHVPRWFNASRSTASYGVEEKLRFLSLEVDCYFRLSIELEVQSLQGLEKLLLRLADGLDPRDLPASAIDDAIEVAVENDQWDNVFQGIIDLGQDGLVEASDEDIEREGLEVDADSSHPVFAIRWIGDGHSLWKWSKISLFSGLGLIAVNGTPSSVVVEVDGQRMSCDLESPSKSDDQVTAADLRAFTRWCRGL